MVTTRKKAARSKPVLLLAIVLAFGVVSLISLNYAEGSDPVSSDTIGLGEQQSTRQPESQELPSAKLNVPKSDSADATTANAVQTNRSAESLQQPAQRTITVKDPDPVVAIIAVDQSNPDAVAHAQKVGETHPLPTAPRIAPDTSGPEWHTGIASAYDLEPNSSWNLTASGIELTPTSVTVAVPQSQHYLLGRVVEIVYEDQVVVATITDTGGFEGYGRALDLAGGVWQAFGAQTQEEWGLREVKYRIL